MALLAIEDADVAVRVTRACPALALEREHLYTLVDALGEDAVGPLEVWLDRRVSERAMIRGTVARALSLIDTPAAVSILARHSDDPEVRRTVREDASPSRRGAAGA